MQKGKNCKVPLAIECGAERIFFPERVKNSMATIPISFHNLKKSPLYRRGASYSVNQFSRNKLWMKSLHGVKVRAQSRQRVNAARQMLDR